MGDRETKDVHIAKQNSCKSEEVAHGRRSLLVRQMTEDQSLEYTEALKNQAPNKVSIPTQLLN